MTDNIIIPFISICAEARPTRRRNGVTFQQYVLGACCACPSASWNECSTAPVSLFAITARKPFDAPTQVDAGCGPSRHVAILGGKAQQRNERQSPCAALGDLNAAVAPSGDGPRDWLG